MCLSPKLEPCTYKAFLSGICLQPAVNIRGVMKATTAVGVSEESKRRLSVHIKFKFSNVYHQWYPH